MSSTDEKPRPADEPELGPARGPWQFSIASLLVTMALVSVLAAALGGLLDPSQTTYPRGFFVVMIVAAPLLVMIVASLLVAMRRWFDRR